MVDKLINYYLCNFKVDLIGKYTVKSFPPNRQLLAETYDFFLKKHYMTGYIEVDVTEGKKIIDSYELKDGNKISFTSWITKCLSNTIEEFPQFNSFRKGRNKLIQFDDIDIIVMVEREINDNKIPIAHSIRRTQDKDLIEISDEIRKTQTKSVSEKDQLLDQDNKAKYFQFLPKFLRSILMKRYVNNPFVIKKNGGLIVITSIGMFVDIPGWIGGFGGLTTLNLSIGGIHPKLVKLDDQIIEKQFLNITISFDHDILDGGPAARFTQRFVNYLESAAFLKDL
ncbi:MAG: 2-oxo acid dehydrogenase subunit E2 [Candidatus Kariarchaeaceae archaeon]|jgi:pyruvate/2-oxoglutarate dehydrogenase complex dihydrolipoamide acyltransferase (E2) component